MWNNGYGMMVYGWGWIMMIGIVILAVLGIFALIRYLKQPDRTGSRSALDILNERYAKGEINDEEYQKIKAQLNK